MKSGKALVVGLILLGCVLIVIAVVYFADTAHALPSFFPGHSSAPSSHHHVKHGIAAFVLALGCFVLAWFQSGPKSASPAT